jgi:hypothetical protein
MKKLLFGTLAILGCTNYSIGQTKASNEFIKPSKGDWAFEIGTVPNLKGGPFFTLNDGLLQNVFDQINTDSTQTDALSYPVLKTRRFISNNIAERYIVNLTVVNSSDSLFSQTNFGLSLGYGREKHFRGSDRLSTYLGWDIAIAFASIQVERGNNLGGFGFSARGFTGMDYYIAPKLYLGTEFGVGFNQTISNSSSFQFNLKPTLNPIIRLGYRL